MDMKRSIRFILAIGALILFGYGIYYLKYPLTPKLRINNHIFTYEIAITDEKRQKGLSGRKSLPQNHGMLFVFQDKGYHPFWMKGMKFPLDFIWIDDNTVVDLTENVPPPKEGEEPAHVVPKALVNRVFEVRAGTIKDLNIQIGDRVEYLKR